MNNGREKDRLERNLIIISRLVFIVCMLVVVAVAMLVAHFAMRVVPG